MFLLSAAHFRYEPLAILHTPQATLFLCTAGVRRIKKALSLTLNAAASFVKPFLSHATAAIMSLGWFVAKSIHQKISFFHVAYPLHQKNTDFQPAVCTVS